jgi:hypothetical protein
VGWSSSINQESDQVPITNPEDAHARESMIFEADDWLVGAV